MNLKLRAVDDLDEARELAPFAEERAIESIRPFREDPPAPGFFLRFVEERFGRRETLVLVAEAQDRELPLALCVTGPFEDPLTAESAAMIVVLYVDPSIRHRGVARSLVKEARRLLAARGVRNLTARAGHNDDAFISMGERWGFVRSWELMEGE